MYTKLLSCYLNSNPTIFDEKKSPQEVPHILDFQPPKNKKCQKGRWVRMGERSKKIRMSLEVTQIMEKASQQFREEFAFNHDIDEKNRKFLFDTNALNSFTRESNDGYHAISSKVASLDDSDELYASSLSLEYGIRHAKKTKR